MVVFDFIQESADLKDEGTGKPIVSTLVKFATGSLFSGGSTQQLFQADGCFNKIISPVAHDAYEAFKRALIISLQCG